MFSQLDPHVVILLAAGPAMVISGMIYRIFRPKNINSFYGYRTRRSKKSEEHWEFAQRYSSIQILIAGGLTSVLGLLGLLIHLPTFHSTIVGLVVLLSIVVLFFILTERAIQKKFPD